MLPKKGSHYTLEDIHGAIDEKLIESETLDYKSEPAKYEPVLAKAVSAFANSGGGNLVLGIGESATGEPVDTDPPGLPKLIGRVPTAEQIDRWIRTKVFPNPPAHVESVEINNERVYVIISVAPRGGGVYRIVDTTESALNGRYYVRRGRESIEAGHYELRSLFAEAEASLLRVRQYLERRGLAEETSTGFGERWPFSSIPTVTWTSANNWSGHGLEITQERGNKHRPLVGIVALSGFV